MNVSMAALKLYGGILRILRPNSGLTILCHNRFVNVLASGLGDKVWTTTLGGVEIEVNPQDYHGRILLLTGTNDFKVSRVVSALSRSGDIFLDIGANYSTIGLSAARKVGPSGHVHLFEPQVYLADIVEAALHRAGLGDRVTMHRVALYDADGEMRMAVPDWHSGRASLEIQGSTSQGWSNLTVPTRNTFDYLSPLVEGRSFGVKIDVEGAEPTILPGLIRLGGMRFCVFEGANNKKDLFEVFSSAGFSIFGLKRSIRVARVVRVASLHNWETYHDFVAVPSEVGVVGSEISPNALRALLSR